MALLGSWLRVLPRASVSLVRTGGSRPINRLRSAHTARPPRNHPQGSRGPPLADTIFLDTRLSFCPLTGPAMMSSLNRVREHLTSGERRWRVR